MQEPTVLTATESERKELEAVLSGLARTPRLAKLLRYLVEKQLGGAAAHLTEYNIATEVFDRNKSNFIASDDAIARVETHRLRKKLKSFYESEGRDHPIRIEIPAGTYVPVFVLLSVANPSLSPDRGLVSDTEPPSMDDTKSISSGDEIPASPHRPEKEPDSHTALPVKPREHGRQFWPYAAALGVAIILSFGVYKIISSPKGYSNRNSTASSTQPVVGDGIASIAAVSIPFRMIAGYSGPPQTDSMGSTWLADQYFRDGWPAQRPSIFIARTSDPVIFSRGRSGDFFYDIPLKPGTYELHLYFLQASETAQSEDVENKAIFNVAGNGKVMLDAFDIVSDAMGRNIADERVFRDVSPASDGLLHLHFSTVVGTPSLSALAILEGTPHKQLPIRLSTQVAPYTDSRGQLWHPDNYYLGGRHLSHNLPNSASSDTASLQTERYGHFSYAIPVDPRGRYTVVLHFAELFFGGDGAAGAGQRVFRVLCNGNTLLDDFDIYKEVGSFKPVEKTFYHLKPTAQGKLDLTFEPIVNYATISAIEVLDESSQ